MKFNKNARLVLITMPASALVISSGCGEKAPATEQSAAQESESAGISFSGEDANISRGTDGSISVDSDEASISVGPNGISVSGLTERITEVATGITISTSTMASTATVTSEGVATAETHLITIEQVTNIEESHTYDEMMAITKKDPLYNTNKETDLESGFGYYFVNDGSLWMVVFEEQVVDNVFPVGTHTGLSVTTSTATANNVQLTQPHQARQLLEILQQFKAVAPRLRPIATAMQHLKAVVPRLRPIATAVQQLKVVVPKLKP